MVNNNIVKAIKETDYFLLDMDGTLYLDDVLIGEMDKTLGNLRANGKKLVFLTNNSSKSKTKYIDKLRKLKLFSDGDEVYTSGMATADHLLAARPGQTVCLLGTEALRKEFEERKIKIDDVDPDVCVLAYDTELTYEKLCTFTRNVKKGAYYIATHPDINCPAPDVFVPDAGAFMALIEKSTGLLPTEIVGKPFPLMGKSLMRRFNVGPEKFTMVGDRLYTDIKFGNNCGFHTILVLSGESTVNDIPSSGAKPEFILNDLNEINKFLN